MNKVFETLTGVRTYFADKNAVKEMFEIHDNIYWGDPVEYNGVDVPGIVLYSEGSQEAFVILTLSSYEHDPRFDFSGEGYAFCIIQAKNRKETKRAYRLDANIAANIFEEFVSELNKDTSLAYFISDWNIAIQDSVGYIASPKNPKTAWEYLCYFYYKELKRYFEENYFDNFKLYKVYNTTETPVFLIDKDGDATLSLAYASIPLNLPEIAKTLLKTMINSASAKETTEEKTGKEVILSSGETVFTGDFSQMEIETIRNILRVGPKDIPETIPCCTIKDIELTYEDARNVLKYFDANEFEEEFKNLGIVEKEDVMRKLKNMAEFLITEEEFCKQLELFPFEAPEEIHASKECWKAMIEKYVRLRTMRNQAGAFTDAVMYTLNEWLSRTNNVNFKPIQCPYAEEDIRIEITFDDLWNCTSRTFGLTKPEVFYYKDLFRKTYAKHLSESNE